MELVAVKVLLISLYKRSFYIYIYIYPIYLNIFPYIVVYYRLVIYLLNNLIGLRISRMSYYRGIIYNFKYLKL